MENWTVHNIFADEDQWEDVLIKDFNSIEVRATLSSGEYQHEDVMYTYLLFVGLPFESNSKLIAAFRTKVVQLLDSVESNNRSGEWGTRLYFDRLGDMYIALEQIDTYFSSSEGMTTFEV